MFGKTKDKFQSEKTNFNHKVHMSKTFAHIVTKIIEMLMEFLLQMEFYLIMKVQSEVKILKKIVSSLCKIKLGYKKI